MDFKELINEDQKQYVNLSSFSYLTIENDRILLSATSNKINRSTFLNIILENIINISPALLSAVGQRTYQSCVKSFSKTNSTITNIDYISNIIAEKEIKHTFDDLNKYPRGHSFTFRLSNSNMNLLSTFNENSYEYTYFKKPGRFLKAVFESYAHLPYYKRESIYFQNKIDYVQTAIQLKMLLQIETIHGEKFIVKPYSVLTDEFTNFNYMICLCHPFSEEGQSPIFRCASFRISRIKTIKKTYASFDFSSEDVKLITSAISENGIQFLVSTPEEIIIKLTDEGKRLYNEILYLRPNYSFIENNNVYHFQVSPRQIEYYFFKFGNDATVLSPVWLKEKFKEKYQQALSKYI